MSENYNYHNLGEEHLMAVIDHAQSQIEEWTRRRDVAIGHLASRGEVLMEYPESN